jgi:hypothetical protein
MTPWGFLKEWSAGFIVAPDIEEIMGALRSFGRGFTWTDTKRCQMARRARNHFGMTNLGRKYKETYEFVGKK